MAVGWVLYGFLSPIGHSGDDQCLLVTWGIILAESPLIALPKLLLIISGGQVTF